MYIVHITPEIAPAAKVGGLADVVFGLSREMMRREHAVDVILPMYAGLRFDEIEGLHEVYSQLWVPYGDHWRPEKVFEGRVHGIKCFFITGGHFTERHNVYGYDDDLYRFTYFCRAALEFMMKTEKRPEILHVHDWTTALVPVMYYDLYAPLGWTDTRVVFTIHNNENQGLCWYGPDLLRMVEMDAGRYHKPDKLQDESKPNCLNLMRGGIVYSNFVTAVSPTYAREMQEPVGGRGLHNVLRVFSDRFGGVLNGLDYQAWDPATDPKLAARYSAGPDFVEKYRNKYALREWLQLRDAWMPIVAYVGRLTPQKGLGLIRHAIYAALARGAQFVLLGNSPDPAVNADFWRIKNELAESPDVHLWLGYHEDLAHLVYAGSDILIAPSLYEPCGLTQMIALRYGTVPVVRRTGGLADSVFDTEFSGRPLEETNGFVFDDPAPAGIEWALGRAIDCWYKHADCFNALARQGMGFDYSWRAPGRHYENIYNHIRAK